MNKKETSKFSILIVEDEPIVAKDLQETLREMGYDAYAIASSADDAIRRATEKCPDLALMDIRIRGARDGIQTAEILREQFGVSVVYLTAHADDATIERAARTAPYGYLLKPIKNAELRSAVEVAAFKQKLDKAISERERRLSTALNAISDAVVAVDLAGKVTYLNPAAEALIGATAESAIGKTADQVLQLMDRGSEATAATPLEAALQGKHVDLGEMSLRNISTGLRSSINETAAPILEAGNLRGAVMVFRDVGEKKKMQQQLELSDRLASLGTMAAGTAHELNNPLTIVVTNAGFLAEELLQIEDDLRTGASHDLMAKKFKRMFDALGDVQAAASRMGRIVADLRGFARPVEQDSKAMDLCRCIEWAVRATSHEFHHRANLRTRIEQAPAVIGDSSRLEQVLVNLLVNAAHAIAPGNAEANEVSVRLSTGSQGHAVIEIRDSGSGIRAEDLRKIFEPFFTTKAAGSGTGLGLSICHGIVKSLGGDISVESELGTGTTFTVVLPAAPIKAAVAPTQEAARAPAMRGRVLLIDDENALLRAMQRILEDEEHFVEVTQSARDALAMIERGDRFDLILSDLMMPMMTGIDFYEALLARNPALAHSVVFVSGGAITAKADAFLRSVTNLRMEKPFKAAQLRDIVQRGLIQRPGVGPR